MNFRVPQKVENLCNSWATISFLRRTMLHGVKSDLRTGYGGSHKPCVESSIQISYWHMQQNKLFVAWYTYRRLNTPPPHWVSFLISKTKRSLHTTGKHSISTLSMWADLYPRILNLGARWRWVISFTPRPLYQGEEHPVPIGWEAGWAPEPVWTRWRRKKFLAPAGNRNPIVQPVA
jgi:hypothetical protein